VPERLNCPADRSAYVLLVFCRENVPLLVEALALDHRYNHDVAPRANGRAGYLPLTPERSEEFKASRRYWLHELVLVILPM
jgi:hypothetical protein